MSIDVEVLSELYLNLKEYIPTKDRQAAADNVMSTAVDMLGDSDLKDFAATDKFLGRALAEYVGEEEADEDTDFGD
jgi:hypothetical protein